MSSSNAMVRKGKTSYVKAQYHFIWLHGLDHWALSTVQYKSSLWFTGIIRQQPGLPAELCLNIELVKLKG